MKRSVDFPLRAVSQMLQRRDYREKGQVIGFYYDRGE
jgi:hypothetical protein